MCIYCDDEDNLTISDIIPDSMTAAKLTCKNVCKNHNNLTNSKFEDKFSKFYAFFRNEFGFTTRKFSEPIRFKADIYANGELILKNSSFYTLRKFYENYTYTDENGDICLKNINPKFLHIKNPKITLVSKIEWFELFLSETAIRTIAKICYEYHCLNNNIMTKNDRYNKIIDFILEKTSKNDFVEIIDNDLFDEITLPSLNYIEGAHGLMEITENGKRFVICSLFGVVWYKTFICNDFASNYNEGVLSLFLLDGSKKEHQIINYSAECSFDGKIGDVQSGVIFGLDSIPINKINDVNNFLNRKREKFRHLISGAIVTTRLLNKYCDHLEDIKYQELTDDELAKILTYREHDTIMALICFYFISDIDGNFADERAFFKVFEEKLSSFYSNEDKFYDIYYSQDLIEKVTIGMSKFKSYSFLLDVLS